MKRTPFVFAIAAAAAIPALAFAQQTASDAFVKAMQAMMDGMHVEGSGDADKDFARMMIPHHEGAIAMAKAELKYGRDAQIRAMAEKIIAAQQAEIAELKAWLEAHP